MTSSVKLTFLGRPIAALAVAAACLGAPAARAEGVTEAEIAASLMGPAPVKTRSLSVGAPAAAPSGDAAFVDSLRDNLRAKTSRPLSAQEREKLAAISGGKPSIDLDIPFDFGSAEIGPKARPVVARLGAALARPELRAGTYVIAGHTDAKGGEAVNQSLSARRAEAVKRHLVAQHGLSPDRLITVGYGKTRLKNAGAPFADENRRVQATNISDVKSASR